MHLCPQATLQSQTISTTAHTKVTGSRSRVASDNDTCFTGLQVKEIYKVILEYETCKKVMVLKDSTISDQDKIIALKDGQVNLMQTELDKRQRKIKWLQLQTRLSFGVAILTTIIAIIK